MTDFSFEALDFPSCKLKIPRGAIEVNGVVDDFDPKTLNERQNLRAKILLGQIVMGINSLKSHVIIVVIGENIDWYTLDLDVYTVKFMEFKIAFMEKYRDKIVSDIVKSKKRQSKFIFPVHKRRRAKPKLTFAKKKK